MHCALLRLSLAPSARKQAWEGGEGGRCLLSDGCREREKYRVQKGGRHVRVETTGRIGGNGDAWKRKKKRRPIERETETTVGGRKDDGGE